MTKKQLKDRWVAIPECDRSKINELIENAGVLDETYSVFGRTEDGLLDFRGIDLRNYRIVGVEFSNVDFSHAIINEAWIANSMFENVVFKETELKNISELGNRFLKCKFFNSKLNRACLGYKGSVYEKTEFNKVNFTGTSFIRAEFNYCNFSDNTLKGIDFNACSFENTEFKGVLDDVWFRGGFPSKVLNEQFGQPRPNNMLNVSLENSVLTDITFSDFCNLSTVKLPKNGNYIYIRNWNKKLQSAYEKIKEWQPAQRTEAEILIKSYLVHSVRQNEYILNSNDLLKRFGREVSNKIIMLLTQE